MSRPYGKRKSVLGPRQGANNQGQRGGGPNGGFAYNNPPSYGSRNGRQAGGGGGGHNFGRGRGYNNNNNRSGGGGQSRNGGGGGGPNASADVMKTLLGLLFEKSQSHVFVEESGMLILTNMRSSPDLSAAQRSVDFNSVTFCKALAEVLRDKFGHRLRVLQLDDNGISKLSVLLNALQDADLQGGITAISARSNRISELSFLGSLKHYDNLGELLLTGNPVVDSKNYFAQVSRQIPRLQMLDGQPIQRGLLALPNPIAPPAFDSMQLSALHHLEQTLFQHMQSRQLEHAEQLYSQLHSCLSVSKFADPIPSRLPFDSVHNSGDLSRQLRNSMSADMSQVRSAVQWRNLQSDIQSTRNIATTRQAIVSALRAVVGGTKPLQYQQILSANANVVFLQAGMKVPVCVLTVHGKLRYAWSPPGEVRAPGTEPFVACFFDRTMTLTWDGSTNTWAIANDQLFMRPDRAVVHDDGSSSEALFFANTPTRVAQMGRRLLSEASPEVMRDLVSRCMSDRDLQNAVAQLRALPADQFSAAMTSSAAMASAMGWQ